MDVMVNPLRSPLIWSNFHNKSIFSVSQGFPGGLKELLRRHLSHKSVFLFHFIFHDQTSVPSTLTFTLVFRFNSILDVRLWRSLILCRPVRDPGPATDPRFDLCEFESVIKTQTVEGADLHAWTCSLCLSVSESVCDFTWTLHLAAACLTPAWWETHDLPFSDEELLCWAVGADACLKDGF